jgi:hypothetical protein
LTRKHYRIEKVQQSTKTISFAFDPELAEILRKAGERFGLSDDGKRILLEVQDPEILEKVCDGRYKALLVMGDGALAMIDNPNAAGAIRMLKRDAGNGSFASAHAQLQPHRTGPIALKPERLAKMALGKKPGDRGTAMLAAIHNAGPTKQRALRSERNLKLRAVLAKCAGQSYPNPDAAKLALTQECVKSGLADLIEQL